MAQKFATIFCKPNTLRFYPIDRPSSFKSATDDYSYNDSKLEWQTAKPYEQKLTFEDMVTIQVHVQANVIGTVSSYPEINIYKIDGTLVTTISVPPYTRGSQQNPNNFYYPNDGAPPILLDSFLYEWTFEFLDPTTDSGCYYCILKNTAADGIDATFYKSEPILLYNEVPNTILIGAYNNTNRASQNVLVDGWIYNFPHLFTLRVEGYVNLYKPKTVYIGYLQQQYTPQQLSAQNVRSFTLQIGGSPTDGVPDWILEKVSELLIMDNFYIVDKDSLTAYTYDSEGSDSSPKVFGDKSDPEASQLCWAKFPIREKYSNQNAFYGQF